jgi:tRNA acetyltransferase TAN1
MLHQILTVAYIRQNVLGMSVVGPDFEKLRRFNIEELRQPLSSAGSEATNQPEKSTESKAEA